MMLSSGPPPAIFVLFFLQLRIFVIAAVGVDLEFYKRFSPSKQTFIWGYPEFGPAHDLGHIELVHYVNETIYPLFDPPIEIVGRGIPDPEFGVLSSADVAGIDYVHLDQQKHVCLQLSHATQAIATRISRIGNTGITTGYTGGAIFTLVNNTEINDLADIRDKVILTLIPSNFPSAVIHREAIRVAAGFDIMAEARKIIIMRRFNFTSILNGHADVVFLPAGIYEAFQGLGFLQPNLFKALNPPQAANTTSSSSSLSSFPYQLSTALYPEFAIAWIPEHSSPDVDWIVTKAINEALIALNGTHTAMVNLGMDRFESPFSYAKVHDALIEIGLAKQDPMSLTRECEVPQDIYSSITCSEGYYKRSRVQFNTDCGKEDCPYGMTCTCRPCRKAEPVEIFRANNTSCEKLSICAKVKQNEPMTFTIRDNLNRNLPISYLFRVETTTPGISFPRYGNLSSSGNSTYTLLLATAQKGEHILEIFINNEKTSVSPVLVTVSERSCGYNFKASATTGECLMTKKYVYFDRWFQYFCIVLVAIAVAISLFCAAWTYQNRELKIVVASQPIFLYILCLGCGVSSIAILFVGLDDDPNYGISARNLDFTCNAFLWVHTLGFNLTISALFTKMFRVKQLMIDAISTNVDQSLIPHIKGIVKSFFLEAIIITTFSVISPLRWKRYCGQQSEDENEFCTSIGRCHSTLGLPLFGVVLLLHMSYIVYTLITCYQARTIPQEFAEHKWITAACISMAEIILVVPLLIALTWDYPMISSFLLAVSLFLNDISVLLMVFLPKMHLISQADTEKTLRQEDVMFNLRKKVRNIKDIKHSNLERNMKRSSPITKSKTGVRSLPGRGGCSFENESNPGSLGFHPDRSANRALTNMFRISPETDVSVVNVLATADKSQRTFPTPTQLQVSANTSISKANFRRSASRSISRS
eukprot:jgi/Bigna1/84266/fgenesh1_pg.128_\